MWGGGRARTPRWGSRRVVSVASGTRTKMTIPFMYRIFSNIAVGAQGECWEYQGGRSKGGYGKAKTGRRWLFVHRIVAEASFGTIPDGMMVLHQCDNPPCCNPAHLRLGTAAENARDAVRKG